MTRSTSSSATPSKPRHLSHVLSALILLSALGRASAQTNGPSGLEIIDALSEPPRAYTQIPFWFWNGPLEPEQFRRQLRAMASQGVYAAMPHPRFGMDRRQYLEAPYWEAMTATLDEAKKLGMQIWLYDEYNWPSGGAGGRVTQDHPQWYPRGLDYRVYEFDAESQTVTLERPEATEPRLGHFEKIVKGFIKPKGEPVASYRPWGTISADGAAVSGLVPQGPCDVLVFFQVLGRNPSIMDIGSGSFIDYLAEEPAQRFLSLTHEEYFKRYGSDFGDVIPAIFTDETSTTTPAPFPWTERFAEVFGAAGGQDILDRLPELLEPDSEKASELRLAYWQTVTDLFAQGAMGTVASWCQGHGLGFTGHIYEENIQSYAHSTQLMTILRLMDTPGFDALGPRCRPSMAKAAVSVAQLQGKDALCECLGLAEGWNCTLDMLRTGYNGLGTLGVSRFVPHAFFQTVDNPRVECPPSFFEQNPYWKYYRTIAALSARLSYFNSCGTHVAPCAVYYPIESLWADSVGGKGPNVLPWQHRTEGNAEARRTGKVFNELIDALFENRWDMDIVDDAFLADSSVHIGGGTTKLSVGPEQFRVLIVPPVTAIGLKSLRAIDRFLAQGGQVVWIERLPRMTWPLNDGEPQRTLRRWYGSASPELGKAVTVGQGRLVLLPGDRNVVCEYLDRELGPEVAVSDGLDALRVTHRRTPQADLFLLFNDSERFVSGRAKLSDGGEAMLVDMDSGQAYRGTAEASGLPVALRPRQSICAVFGQGNASLPAWGCDRPAGTKVDISTDWTIQLAGSQLDDEWRCSLGSTEVNLPVFRMKGRGSYEQVAGWTQRDYDDGDWKQVHALRRNAQSAEDASVLLRAVLPPGARSIARPLPVAGEYAAWVNGRLLAKSLGPVRADEGPFALPPLSELVGNVLALETYAHHAEAGLTAPLRITCGPAPIEQLQSWTDLGFGYYSGRVLYKKSVRIEGGARKVWLDLGQVQHYVEVYVNGTLVDTLLWPPYELQITDHVTEGDNEIALVVSNSLANRFAWDVWGTRGTGQAEPSGVLGPACLRVQR